MAADGRCAPWCSTSPASAAAAAARQPTRAAPQLAFCLVPAPPPLRPTMRSCRREPLLVHGATPGAEPPPPAPQAESRTVLRSSSTAAKECGPLRCPPHLLRTERPAGVQAPAAAARARQFLRLPSPVARAAAYSLPVPARAAQDRTLCCAAYARSPRRHPAQPRAAAPTAAGPRAQPPACSLGQLARLLELGRSTLQDPAKGRGAPSRRQRQAAAGTAAVKVAANVSLSSSIFLQSSTGAGLRGERGKMRRGKKARRCRLRVRTGSVDT